MPAKRDVLQHLSRDDFLDDVAEHDLTVADRRVRDQLVEALASSKKVTLAAVAPSARDRLNELCRALHLEDSAKEKAAITTAVIELLERRCRS